MMERKLYRSSAPGSLMLLGEHAVLYDRPSIVFSIDKRVTVLLESRPDNLVCIDSQLGRLETSLEYLTVVAPFEFVIHSILEFRGKIPSGLNLKIQSNFSSTVGLGSSAAVTVATIAVLYQWVHPGSCLNTYSVCQEIFAISKKVIRLVQGIASGADIAASVFGGLVVYQQKEPSILKRINALLPIVVLYSGNKTPTVQVVNLVKERSKQYPHVFECLYDAMGHLVLQAVGLIEQKEWHLLGNILKIQQGIMQALGVSTPSLASLVEELNIQPTIYGAKISGSGLGDCVIGLGQSHHTSEAIFGSQGLAYE